MKRGIPLLILIVCMLVIALSGQTNTMARGFAWGIGREMAHKALR